MHIQSTIAAISTAVGEAGISVIRLSGSSAIPLFSTIWRGRDLAVQKSHTVVFGRIFSENEIIDEVLVSIFRAPDSYTGEDVLEVSCHGGFLNTRRVYEAILGCGFRPAEPGEFTHRAFLNGKMDLTQAEAVADMIHARSEIELKNASRQLEGVLGEKMRQFRRELIDFTALIELELDFSEEDVEFARRDDLISLLDRISSEVDALLESYQAGKLVRDGVRTAIAGLPNAGKSTLLNALLEKDRAIVSPIAGTTRDTIEAEWSHKGLRFILVDTAGIRETSDFIEELGVSRSREAVLSADIIVFLLDATDPEQTPESIQQRLQFPDLAGKTILTVLNKVDISSPTFSGDVVISAKQHTGLGALKDALFAAAMSNKQFDSNRFVLTSARHQRELIQLRESLTKALGFLRSGRSGELVSMDLRRALHHLGAITGQITTEDLLDSIFSRFCIGK